MNSASKWRRVACRATLVLTVFGLSVGTQWLIAVVGFSKCSKHAFIIKEAPPRTDAWPAYPQLLVSYENPFGQLRMDSAIVGFPWRYPELRQESRKYPDWSAIRIGEAQQDNRRYVVELAVGWPARSALCRASIPFDTDTWSISDSPFQLPMEGGVGAFEMCYEIDSRAVRGIPLRPIVGGMVANAAIIAGLSAGLLMTVRGSRMVWRRSRQCCAACGYPLIPGVPCPECGLLRKRPKINVSSRRCPLS